MRSIAKWVGPILVGLVLTALFQQPLADKFRAWGVYDLSTDDALNWMESIIGVSAFPWIAGGAFGFCAGVWLDWALRRFKAKPDRHKPLAARSYNLSEKIKKTLRRGFTDEAQLNNITATSVSLLIKFKKLGYKTPIYNSGIHTAENLKILYAYFDQLYPFMQNGQIAEAKKIASMFVKRLSGKSV